MIDRKASENLLYAVIIALFALAVTMGMTLVYQRRQMLAVIPTALTPAAIDCQQSKCDPSNRGDESDKFPAVKKIHDDFLRQVAEEDAKAAKVKLERRTP